jgi:hypothetical protein
MFINNIDESVGATIVEGLQRSDTWLRAVQFRVLGGAISRVAPDATAYAHRNAAIMINIVRALDGDESGARRWTQELAAGLDQGVEGCYVNFFHAEAITPVDGL